MRAVVDHDPVTGHPRPLRLLTFNVLFKGDVRARLRVLGAILFVAGLIGELIAGLRAQLRELRRQVTELERDR